MKLFRLIPLFLLCCFLTTWALQEAPKPPKVEQGMFNVMGDQPWTNTQLHIRPQDRVTLTASGQVRFSKGEALSSVGPDGYQGAHGPYPDAWPGDYLQCDDPLTDANHAALIAEVNNEVFIEGVAQSIRGQGRHPGARHQRLLLHAGPGFLQHRRVPGDRQDRTGRAQEKIKRGAPKGVPHGDTCH